VRQDESRNCSSFFSGRFPESSRETGCRDKDLRNTSANPRLSFLKHDRACLEHNVLARSIFIFNIPGAIPPTSYSDRIGHESSAAFLVQRSRGCPEIVSSEAIDEECLMPRKNSTAEWIIFVHHIFSELVCQTDLSCLNCLICAGWRVANRTERTSVVHVVLINSLVPNIRIIRQIAIWRQREFFEITS